MEEKLKAIKEKVLKENSTDYFLLDDIDVLKAKVKYLEDIINDIIELF